MKNIEEFIENPGAQDVPVKDVFTESMFTELETRMADAGWGQVRSYWESDYQNRKIISEFMKVSECVMKCFMYCMNLHFDFFACNISYITHDV